MGGRRWTKQEFGEWNWLNAPHPSWAGAGAKRWKIPYHKTIPLARSFQR
ncbi:hypothetical protein LEP1GSC050_0791 [Leptospira broomii serovar Hurstbridge str. 5399]|uniref:Uncharacterized protein n=1 Tax=Leptospira broomii serovar Hurstbridge str. 5399 TaxID=1049789 RepID=T0FGL6_9LEPT|nr:hypothetical protein LEP1GSC050_0791 [Leptospira broomii serovar Hurstbridge str. 5399]